MSHSGEADYLLNSDLLNKIFDDIAEDALSRCVSADPSDDELRRTTTQEVRAIRAVREQLQALLRAETKHKHRPRA